MSTSTLIHQPALVTTAPYIKDETLPLIKSESLIKTESSVQHPANLEQLLKQDLDVNTEELKDLLDDFDIEDLLHFDANAKGQPRSAFTNATRVAGGVTQGNEQMMDDEFDDFDDSDDEFLANKQLNPLEYLKEDPNNTEGDHMMMGQDYQVVDQELLHEK